jgi:hypothetical protein
MNEKLVKRNYDTIRTQKESIDELFEKFVIESSPSDATKKFHLTKGWKGKTSQLDDVSDKELEDVKKFFTSDKPKTKLNEKNDPMIRFRKRIDALRLVPTRSGSKGDEE